MVQIDDLTDEADPVNVPATSDEHPNWRRRLSMTLEELAAGHVSSISPKSSGPNAANQALPKRRNMSESAAMPIRGRPTVCNSTGVRFPRRRGSCSYLARLGISHVMPRLHEGAAGQHPRVMTSQTMASSSGSALQRIQTCSVVSAGGLFAAFGPEDFGDIDETWPGSQFLQGHR